MTKIRGVNLPIRFAHQHATPPQSTLVILGYTPPSTRLILSGNLVTRSAYTPLLLSAGCLRFTLRRCTSRSTILPAAFNPGQFVSTDPKAGW